MTTQEVKRKLTAILSADVKGYSRLMSEDEKGTVHTLNAYREVITGLIQHHRGRVVDAPGDNVLAEFASVVDTVECAVQIQKELKTRNADSPENRRMEYRIGVNLGDVIEDGERILGDGVNIAARLESLSEAGGICISGTAYDQVESKLSLGYEYLGEQAVKNIAKPVRVYRVLMEPEAAGKVLGDKKINRGGGQKTAFIVAAVVIVVFAAVALWSLYFRPAPQREVASRGKTTFPLPDKPSIAVLPFVNMSGDSEQEYFSDGITEDIITNLSKLSGLFVVSRNSTFLYKGKHVKIEEVARDLGVRHVLEGSVRRAGGRLRITAQLIDGKTGQHVWAEKYDRELKDIFSVQDEVTRKVVSELAVALTATESERMARKRTEKFEPYDMLLRAIRVSYAIKKETDLKAMEMCQRVIDLDPNFPAGYGYLSFLLTRGIRLGWSKSPREDLKKAFELAQKGISIDDESAMSFMALASVYLLQGRHDDALTAANAAVRVIPGDSQTMSWVGFYLHWIGRGEEAVAAVKKAMEVDPMHLYGRNPMYLDFMGYACFTAGMYEESISNLKKSIERFGPAPNRTPFLIASYSMLGRMEEAKESAQQWLKANPSFTLSSWEFGRQYKRPEDRDRLYNALRKAGLPEKPSASIPPSTEVAPKENVTSPLPEKATKPTPPPVPKTEVASKEKMAFPLPDVPSIAVMPFVNMSGDPKQEFFSDGITESIITALSKLHYLFVISRQSTFSYKGKAVKVKQVSEELGVRYVLEGSVLRSADRIRINAQLIDALTGHHLWAERYERDLKDIFALQDEITLKIVKAMQVKLTDGEQFFSGGKSGKPSLDCFMKVTEGFKYFEGFNIEATRAAQLIAEETIATCPDYPVAYVLMGFVHQMEFLLRIGKSPQESIEKGIEMAQKALAMDDSAPIAHALLCSLYIYKREIDKAISEGERAVALDPSGAFAHEWYAASLNFSGRSEEAIPMFQKAIRLNPVGNTGLYNSFANTLRMTERFEEAASAYQKALQRAPNNILAHIGLAGTYGLMGREKEARAEAEEVLRLNPKFSLEGYAKMLVTNKNQAQMGRYIDALRKAGLK